jgi:hypothetical protein
MAMVTSGCGGAMSLAAAAAIAGEDRDKSDCHFKKTATEYDRKSGIKWLSCTAK